jgi:hypothetical protein
LQIFAKKIPAEFPQIPARNSVFLGPPHFLCFKQRFPWKDSGTKWKIEKSYSVFENKILYLEKLTDIKLNFPMFLEPDFD